MSRILLVEHLDDTPPPDRVRLFLDRTGRRYEVLRPFAGDTLPDDLADIGAVVIYGGAQEAYQTELYPYLADEHTFIRHAVAADVPLLGICLGAQNIAFAHGAEVRTRTDEAYEFGYYPVAPTEAGRALFGDAPTVMPQWHWHNAVLPEGAELLASSELFSNQAYRLGSAWGFQFHPEVTPEVMRFWQGLDMAPWGAPGAQTLAEQQALMAAHDPAIDRWFNGFLAEFFA
ncbi:type 1 glutamine amidotransferase [Pararhodobacter zhoushanensis]|uniref:Gamma-glutamyl-gamma-aminobutyrate hydrolase family protein n=1 Tax=Pararhodobacter zhoushanensis TaxID=2479545 RepID=A0ABT3H0X6_9RHOB|nr:gamma-glutamyl-gamma-aminobutyrate hydrolase family protein [Pararhodobacter zhoushanensis]MCW1933444.1 gamma-glutamyl-gamma-aminobutyrate hydrolase family protein [Pararhodobacter zhoushanensis]